MEHPLLLSYFIDPLSKRREELSTSDDLMILSELYWDHQIIREDDQQLASDQRSGREWKD